MRRFLLTLAFTCLAMPASAADFFGFYLGCPNFVPLGDPVEYHIVFTVGSVPAPSATIIDPLPPGVEFVPGSLVCYMPPGSGDCSYDAPTRTVSWTATGTLAAYDSIDILFSVTTTGLGGPGYVTNTVTASATGYNTDHESHTVLAYTQEEWPVHGEIMTLAESDPNFQMGYATGVSWNPVSEQFIAGWIRTDNNTSQWYVDAGTIDPHGAPGAAHQVNVVGIPGETPIWISVACSTTSPGCLVAWEETQPGDWRASARGRLLDGDGAPIGSELVIAEDPDIARREIDVVYNSTLDEYLVSYVNELDSGVVEVAATRVRAGDGAVLGSAIVATGSDGDRTRVHAAHLPGRDQYLLVFGFEDLAENEEVHAKLAPGNLSGVGAASELILAAGGGDHLAPVVAAEGDEYLVAWAYWDDTWPHLTTEIRARRFAGDGTPLGPTGGFLVDEFQGAQGIQTRGVRFAGEQGYLIGWSYSDNRTPTGIDLHGRFVESGADQAAYTEFPTIATVNWDQLGHFACRSTGLCMVLVDDFEGVKARFVTAWRAHVDGFEDGGFGGWSAVVGATP